MLLSRYNSPEYVLMLPWRRGLELLRKGEERERDARIFHQWVAQLPVMAIAGEYTGFREYKERVTLSNVDLRPTSVIMAELDEVEAQQNGGVKLGT